MDWKGRLAEYVRFSKKDRIAILVIIILIGAVFLLPSLARKQGTPAANKDTAWIAAMKKLEQTTPSAGKDNESYADDNSQHYQYDRPTGHYTKSKGELFYFDPNTLSAEGWKRLGLRDKTIQTIQNYLSKGGKFRKPEDVQRIYGLFPNEYERIAPYIQIEGLPVREKDYTTGQPTVPVQKQPASRYAITDVNAADTTALIALPGIGSKLASRIIGFRDKLGGFYSINQVAETYGLPDSTFQRIKQYLKVGAAVKKLNVNTASVEELKNHPYVKWAIANPLVAYRKEHGPFAKKEDLKKVIAITDEVYEKLSPYISIE